MDEHIPTHPSPTEPSTEESEEQDVEEMSPEELAESNNFVISALIDLLIKKGVISNDEQRCCPVQCWGDKV